MQLSKTLEIQRSISIAGGAPRGPCTSAMDHQPGRLTLFERLCVRNGRPTLEGMLLGVLVHYKQYCNLCYKIGVLSAAANDSPIHQAVAVASCSYPIPSPILVACPCCPVAQLASLPGATCCHCLTPTHLCKTSCVWDACTEGDPQTSVLHKQARWILSQLIIDQCEIYTRTVIFDTGGSVSISCLSRQPCREKYHVCFIISKPNGSFIQLQNHLVCF